MMELFDAADKEDKNAERIRRPSIKYWPDVWRRLKMNKLAMTGLLLICILGIMSFVGTKINGFTYFEQNYSLINSHPDSVHWFGTDELGRDLFTRIWFGVRYSLFIGIMAAFIDFFIGVLYGGIAGISGRKIDSVMMRIAEVMVITAHIVTIAIATLFNRYFFIFYLLASYKRISGAVYAQPSDLLNRCPNNYLFISAYIK
jgi:dipeptide transport system permease protein